MKSTGILLTIISASTGLGALADIALLEPWANTTWHSGGKGTIRWKSEASENNVMCDIQLMNGNKSDGQVVAHITDPHAPVSCSSNSYNVSPLNDLSEGLYWIRVGTKDRWAYSHPFQFQGSGQVDTHNLTKPVAIAPPKAKSISSSQASHSATSSVSSMTDSHVTQTQTNKLTLNPTSTSTTSAKQSSLSNQMERESIHTPSSAVRGFILSNILYLMIGIIAILLQ
ncbi:hypothetical protein LRAMOSA01191 [Lichtheimia ramosa]|uniref:Yeast cell wall synthesis Kre9/Knh1-like N-terminal domain-containing protein n=1 Tax=Lichtheimia ramosa TaxID=688394 RepID=A0A077WL56_9FUNG|nr:hypothetical protein LRAMOSA01191 [Lichtheimia ramosa]